MVPTCLIDVLNFSDEKMTGMNLFLTIYRFLCLSSGCGCQMYLLMVVFITPTGFSSSDICFIACYFLPSTYVDTVLCTYIYI